MRGSRFVGSRHADATSPHALVASGYDSRARASRSPNEWLDGCGRDAGVFDSTVSFTLVSARESRAAISRRDSTPVIIPDQAARLIGRGPAAAITLAEGGLGDARAAPARRAAAHVRLQRAATRHRALRCRSQRARECAPPSSTPGIMITSSSTGPIPRCRVTSRPPSYGSGCRVRGKDPSRRQRRALPRER